MSQACSALLAPSEVTALVSEILRKAANSAAAPTAHTSHIGGRIAARAVWRRSLGGRCVWSGDGAMRELVRPVPTEYWSPACIGETILATRWRNGLCVCCAL